MEIFALVFSSICFVVNLICFIYILRINHKTNQQLKGGDK